jgi:hypothetical protein
LLPDSDGVYQTRHVFVSWQSWICVSFSSKISMSLRDGWNKAGGGRTPGEVPLQLELPGTDEIMWTTVHPRFDTIIARGRQLIRRTGYRIALAARRDLRTLHELVVETARLRAAAL